MAKQEKSDIGWTNITYNPFQVVDENNKFSGWHCQKISPGCANCYAETFNKRLGHSAYDKKLPENFNHHINFKILHQMATSKENKYAFVSSMTDIFGDWVPDHWVWVMFDAIAQNGETQFQLLTKRPARMLDVICKYPKPLPMNVWLGATTENQSMFDERIGALMAIKELYDRILWVSVEPMLSPVKITSGIDWVVCGGESGAKNKRRPMEQEWGLDLLNQCQKLNIPFFFKQWDCSNQADAKKTINGKIIQNYPLQK